MSIIVTVEEVVVTAGSTSQNVIVDVGTQGPAGVGVPVGGTSGQVLAKATATDYDTQWVDQTGGGASDHGALTGLADDDHPQYHNDARGDTRYDALGSAAAAQAAAASYTDTEIAAIPEVAAGTDITVSTLGAITTINVGTVPVRRTEYDANTVMAATADNTPLPLTVPEQTLVGRNTGGNIDALDIDEVRALLGIDAGPARTSDPRLVSTTLTVAANRGYYGRNLSGRSLAVSSLVIHQGVSSGNVCVAVYDNTGSGRSAKPGTRKATSGSVASAGTGIQTYALTSTIDVLPGEWLYVGADNGTVTIGRNGAPSPANLDGFSWQENSAFPAPATATPVSTTASLWVSAP